MTKRTRKSPDTTQRERLYDIADKLVPLLDADEYPICAIVVTGNRNEDLTAHLLMGEHLSEIAQARLDIAAVIIQTLSRHDVKEKILENEKPV